MKEVIEALDTLYPPTLAESWDQVGLHFGQAKNSVQHIMTALDVRPNVVEEAIRKGIDTLIVHHPPIFQPIHRFNLEQARIACYAELIKHDINVYALHTNLDRAWNGMNDWLAEALELTHIESLGGLDEEGQPKLGRMGQWEQALSYEELLKKVKTTFNLDTLVVIGEDIQKEYQKLAIVGGSGSDFYEVAKEAGADAFITGDYTFHEAQEAYEGQQLTLDAGHYIEHIFAKKMQEVLQKLAEEYDWKISISTSEVSTDPFKFE